MKMQILDKLWDGALYPQNIDFSDNSQYAEASRKLAYSGKELIEALSGNQMDLFDKHMKDMRELSEIMEYETFLQGFRMGVKIMIDVMGKEIPEKA